MASKKKLLQAAAGSAGGAAGLDVDQVFSTFLYDGNGSSQAIENNINLGTWATENTVLHLTGDSLNDSSPFSHTVTAVGNTSVNTTTKKYGTGSIYFDGSGDYLRTSSGTYILGTTDFTLEFWAYYADASTTKGIFHLWDGSNTSNYSLGLYHAGSEYVFNFKNGVDGSPSGTITSTGGAIPNNTWHHVAIVRYDNTLKLYVNGTAVTSGTDVSGYNFVMDDLEIGTHWDSSYTFTGYIDDWRITNGSARYTGNFTPPNAALPLDTTASGEGGLVWTKRRGDAVSHTLFDTERGATKRLFSNLTNAETTESTALTSFNSNGFSVGSAAAENNNGSEIVSWTWRKAPKFFDVISIDVADPEPTSVTVNHNLGQQVGMVIMKPYLHTYPWYVWHRSLNANKNLELNTTAAESSFGGTGFSSTSTTITIPGSFVHSGSSNGKCILYLFAHNDGDGEFGPDGDQDIIKCGSYTGTGSEVDVNLGFEPQWILTRRADDPDDWYMVDTMRGIVTSGNDVYLRANLSSAEGTGVDIFDVTSTGFKTKVSSRHTNGGTYIYMAIRRGPLAAPESATDVFNVNANTTSGVEPVSGFVTDFAIAKIPGSVSPWYLTTRLQGTQYLSSHATDAEATINHTAWDRMDGAYNSNMTSYQLWHWKRAPFYFDVVCYTGTGGDFSAKNHNLGVVPEMIWIKNRTTSGTDWPVWVTGFVTGNGPSGTSEYLILNSTAAKASSTGSNLPFGADPTATTFTVGSWSRVNDTGNNYIAYLFASLDGISKVGSYTGDGTTSKNIDCGFSNGARFVMIRRTDSGGGWIVFDTVRGLTTAAADPFLYLDSTAAQSQNVAFDLDPYSSGFNIGGDAGYINASGGSYIFYAIA